MNLHRRRTSAISVPGREAGAALLVSLMLLLIITLIGLTAARTQTLEVRLSSNMQNRNIAVQSGEAALRDGEDGLYIAAYTNFAQNGSGLYTMDLSTTQAWYLNSTVVWTSSSGNVMSYGGNGAPSIGSDNAVQPALFIIEQLPAAATVGESIGTPQYGSGIPPSAVYRVTTKAVGGDTTSTVTLQSLFH